MSRRRSTSRGEDLAARLRRGRDVAERAARPGARELPILEGVAPNTTFDRPQENVLAAARRILVDSGRVFTYGNAVVMDVGEGEQRRLVTVTTDGHAEPGAAPRLANLFVCELPPPSPNRPHR